MFRRFLPVSICSLIFTLIGQEAFACRRQEPVSFDYSPYTKGFRYYNPGEEGVARGEEAYDYEYNALEGAVDDAEWIAIAKFRTEPSEIDGPRQESAPLSRVLIEPVELLKGEDARAREWTTNKGSRILLVADLTSNPSAWPRLRSTVGHRISSRIAEQSESIPYWDRLGIGVPMVRGEGALEDRCAEASIPFIVEGQEYLVVAGQGEIQFVEPVADGNALLVQLVRKRIASPGSNIRRAETAEAFFRSISAAAIISTSRCSEALRKVSNKWMPTMDYAVRSDANALSLKLEGPPFGAHASVSLFSIKHWAALFDYFAFTPEETGAVTCQRGQQFLMFHAQASEWVQAQPEHFSDAFAARLPRFARIENDQVLLDDILTNLDLTGDRRVPLSLVRLWVSEAQTGKNFSGTVSVLRKPLQQD